MNASWTKTAARFKSPRRVVVSFLWRSREKKAEKCRELKRKLEVAERRSAELQAIVERQEHEVQQGRQREMQLQAELQRGTPPVPLLPADPPVSRHGYGARMICLAVNLARVVGLRGAHRALKVFFEWLQIQQDIPHPTTIRNWVLRIGVAEIQKPIEPADDWIWMADHSNQIGPEKALVVLAVRADNLPERGQALQQEDVHVLTVSPGTDWKCADMETIYQDLAERHGSPRAVLTDGAPELRDGAECLKNKRSDTIILPDFKHKAANCLKALLNRNKRFAEFVTQVGKARSSIQQTELAHLTPPGLKRKARFMNLKALLHWAVVVLWLLDTPEAAPRRWMTSERLEEKLGWLRSFADELAIWREYQLVVSRGVTFVNEQGLFRGASEELKTVMLEGLTEAASRELAEQLIEFVAAAEGQLNEGERLPLSTEILESTFAVYKQLERQHSKGGFTSLLAGFSGVLKKCTPESIKRSFSACGTSDVKQWVNDNLGETLTAKRRATYQAFKQASKTVTVLPATSY